MPEPELALVMNSHGSLVGVTIGNDMSSRDIEGENLLDLPQAKIYDRSWALGPWIVLGPTEEEARRWTVSIAIHRDGGVVFTGSTGFDRLKRSFAELTEHLWRSQSFPHGVVLLTGTGVVPDESFTLRPGDRIMLTIDGIGTLANNVIAVWASPHASSNTASISTGTPSGSEPAHAAEAAAMVHERGQDGRAHEPGSPLAGVGVEAVADAALEELAVGARLQGGSR